jgi:hypothetical protein
VITREPPRSGALAATRAALTGLDSLQIAAMCGGLQLLPENGHHIWRLQALADLAGGLTPGGEPPHRAVLRALLNAGALGHVADRQEDPYDDLLAEELAFAEGSFLIAGGMAEDGVPVLRNVVRAVLLSSPRLLPHDAWARLMRVASAVLHLSDATLRSAGLVRGATPEPPLGGAHVPGATTLRRLVELVTFTPEHLRAATGTGDLDCLGPLVREFGPPGFGDSDIFSGVPDRLPLLRAGDTIVLAKPLALAVALRHYLVHDAIAIVGTGPLAERFGAVVDLDVRDALLEIGVAPDVTSRRTVQQPFTEMSAEIDKDLKLTCLIVADQFGAVDAENPYSAWDGKALEAAHQRMEELAAEEGGEVLGIVAARPAGGQAFLGTPVTEADNLAAQTLGTEDFAAICFLERDPLGLWKWARAEETLRGLDQIVAWSVLDLYAVYRRGERSYAEHADLDYLSVMPGVGTAFRVEYKRTRDLHAAKFPDGTVREVRRGGPHAEELPFHYPLDLSGPVRILVGDVAVPLWVCGPEEHGSESWDLVETVAYWVSELRDYITALGLRLPCAAIEVAVARPEVWWGDAEPDLDTPMVKLSSDGLVARMVLGDGIVPLLIQPHNEADRIIATSAARALGEMAPGPPNDAEIEQAVNRAAPRGLKKHLLRFPGAGNEPMEPAPGQPRFVQEADVTRARELLATHLDEFGLRDEVVPQDRRDELLKSAVAFLFERICSILDETNGEGLLQELIAANERLIASSEHRQAILPARLATYPGSADRLRDEVARDNQAGICTRFLIEYVAARPPSGDLPWSLRRHDECLGLLAELIDWAYLDDAVYAGLSAVRLLIREDGQLRLAEYDRYELGRGKFFTGHIAAGRATSESLFPRRFDLADQEREANPTLERVEAPLAEEAGLGFAGLRELLHAARNVAHERGDEVTAMPLENARREIAEAIEEPEAAVGRALDYLSLAPRATFLKPPTGDKRDVLPSRFARRWSYVRRPFVRVEGPGAPSLLWGKRAPVVALRLLVSQLLSGRYQHLAEGPALKAELGRIADETGHAFEDEVAETFEREERQTLRRVDRFGADSLREVEGRDLGDIDVIALDRRSRTVWAVECKDLAAAVTPSDVVDEMAEHFHDRASTLVKHRLRVAWLDRHRAEALRALGEPGIPSGWHVRGVIVTASPVLAPLIADLPLPVVARDDIPAWLRKLPAHRKKRRRR